MRRAALADEVRANSGIEVLADATAFGLYEGNLLGIHHGDTVMKLRARAGCRGHRGCTRRR